MTKVPTDSDHDATSGGGNGNKLFYSDNDNDNDNESFILTYELIKQIIYSTMIDQYSHSQGNYIMTYISLACNYRKMF